MHYWSWFHLLQAMGVSDKKIIGIYLSQFCFTALVGALLGGAISIFIAEGLIIVLSIAMLTIFGKRYHFLGKEAL